MAALAEAFFKIQQDVKNSRMSVFLQRFMKYVLLPR